MTKKRSARKTPTGGEIWSDSQWVVKRGVLQPGPGRKRGKSRLFQVVGEKLPYDALKSVNKDMKTEGLVRTGVYVAHDSMGYARYVGRGSNIFNRLSVCKNKNKLELQYFSFYIVLDKQHEREVETLLIRAAGPLLEFNDRKKPDSIESGNIGDYEADTAYYERRYLRGLRPRRRTRKRTLRR